MSNDHQAKAGPATLVDKKAIVTGLITMAIGGLIGWLVAGISNVDASRVASKLKSDTEFHDVVAGIVELPVGSIIPFKGNDCPNDPRWQPYSAAEGRFAFGANSEIAAGSSSNSTEFRIERKHLPIDFVIDDHGSGPGTLDVVESVKSKTPEDLRPPYFALTWCEKVR